MTEGSEDPEPAANGASTDGTRGAASPAVGLRRKVERVVEELRAGGTMSPDTVEVAAGAFGRLASRLERDGRSSLAEVEPADVAGWVAEPVRARRGARDGLTGATPDGMHGRRARARLWTPSAPSRAATRQPGW